MHWHLQAILSDVTFFISILGIYTAHVYYYFDKMYYITVQTTHVIWWLCQYYFADFGNKICLIRKSISSGVTSLSLDHCLSDWTFHKKILNSNIFKFAMMDLYQEKNPLNFIPPYCNRVSLCNKHYKSCLVWMTLQFNSRNKISQKSLCNKDIIKRYKMVLILYYNKSILCIYSTKLHYAYGK
jgi:hypothetical protein